MTNNDIRKFLIKGGAGQVGFCYAGDNPFLLPFAVSYTIPLLDAIVDTITDVPTHTYFHHYRSINALIDSLSLRCALMLQKSGARAAAIPASQSVNGMQGIYSHKYAAVRSGIGFVGKSGLLVSKENGPRVRLGTVLTDCALSVNDYEPKCECGECNICVASCPALALTGNLWQMGDERSEIIDARACSDYMKKAFQKIGRGAVCGICMKVCPRGK